MERMKRKKKLELPEFDTYLSFYQFTDQNVFTIFYTKSTHKRPQTIWWNWYAFTLVIIYLKWRVRKRFVQLFFIFTGFQWIALGRESEKDWKTVRAERLAAINFYPFDPYMSINDILWNRNKLKEQSHWDWRCINWLTMYMRREKKKNDQIRRWLQLKS